MTIGPQTHFLRARVTPELGEAFALAARVNGRTESEALREAVHAYISVTTQHHAVGAVQPTAQPLDGTVRGDER